MSIIRSTLLAAAETAAYLISRSVRLRASANASLYRAFTSNGNLTKWTYSVWLKRSTISSTQSLFSYNSGGNYMQASLNTDVLQWDQVVGGTTVQARKITNQVFRDVSGWQHLILVWDSGNATSTSRMLVYLNGQQITSFSTNTDPALNTGSFINSAVTHNIGSVAALNSQLFDGYLTEINFIDGQALTPSSFGETDPITGVWKPKKYTGTYGTNGFYLPTSNNATVEALGYDIANGNPELISNGQFISNVTGWTTLNGTTLSWQSGSLARVANTASAAGIAYIPITTVVGQTYYVSSVIAAYNAGAAGRTVGIRKSDDSGYTVNPVLVCSATSATAISGTFTATATTTYIQMFVDVFGTGSCDFSFVSVSLGGYKNHWKPNNISLTAGATYDSMIDTPTMYDDGGTGRGNYATLLSTAGQGNGTYSDGNLGFVSSTLNQWKGAHASIFMPSGKFYFEATIQTLTGNNFFMIGAVGIQTLNTMYANFAGFVANGWSVQCNGATGGTKYNNNGTTNVSNASFASWVVGDTLQCAVDVDAGKIWFGRNNVWLEGSPSAGTTPSYSNLTGSIAPAVSIYSTAGDKLALNCGQRPFAYTPPTGFKAVNTFNIADSTIPNGKKHFDILTWVGDGTLGRSLSGLQFQPDFVWGKARDLSTGNHLLMDSIRGASRSLLSNSTSAELADRGMATFNANGFTLDSQTATRDEINPSTKGMVGWSWKAGGASVWNFDGSLGRTATLTVASPCVVTLTGHGFSATQAVQFTTTGALPTGLLPNTTYYVGNATANTFNLYTNPTDSISGGATGRIDTSGTQSGVHTCKNGSQISANVSAGFSVVSYLGIGANATVGHGLGVAPKMAIVKWRTGGTTESWGVYHASLGATNYLSLNTTNASAASISMWNNTSPTSTVITVGTDTWVNASTRPYIAYCFAEVAGFSKFGSYTGNGSNSGPFIYLGFRARYVLLKRTDTAGFDWWIYDTARDLYNSTSLRITSNAASVDAGTNGIDICANGFRHTQTDINVNANGGTYIYAAFAENPFKNSLAR